MNIDIGYTYKPEYWTTTRIITIAIIGVIILAIIGIAIFTRYEHKLIKKDLEIAIAGGYKFYMDGIEINPENVILSDYEVTFLHNNKKVLLTKPEVWRRF